MGRGLKVMEEIFQPQERAILCDYFGIERPEELRAVDVIAAAATDEDPSHPVLVEPDAEGKLSSYGTANAVARLLLSRIQSRLPQWGVTRNGEVVLSRQHRRAKTRQVDPLPQFLFEINWADSGPGFSWPESYHVAYVPGFERFVVTASFDGTDLWGYTDLAIGWFPEGTDRIEGAKRVVLDWWGESRDHDYEAWADFLGPGLVSEDVALRWRDEVWAAPEDEDLDEDGEPRITYSSKGVPIRFVTVVLKKSAIESGYPGGLARLLERFPDAPHDERLIGIASMSTGEAEGVVADLRSAGVDMDTGGAFADMSLGPFWTAAGISFRCERPEEMFDRGWVASAVDHPPSSGAGRRAMVISFQEAIDRLCTEARSNTSFAPPTSYAAGMAAGMRRAKVREFVESYVASHGRLPAGKHEVPGAGRVTF